MNIKKKIMFVVGEASGDLHTSAVMKQLREIDNSIEFIGTGGDKMIEQGLTALYHIKDLSILGFTEVIKHLPFIHRVKNNLIKTIENEKIETVVLVDYPEFNLNLASKIRDKVKNIIFFISPQIWAWRRNRIKKMKRLLDKIIVVFPFEEKIYKDENIDVEYVGHPLSERIDNYNYISQKEFCEKNNLFVEKEILLLMPGSRLQEIKRILPEVIKAADELAKKYNMQIVIMGSQNIHDDVYYIYAGNIKFNLIREDNYELLKYSKFGIIKSGTSTIEASLHGLPFIVVYSTSCLTYLLGKKFIQVEHIAMPNIIQNEKIVEELIQKHVNSKNIFDMVDKILSDENLIDKIKSKLKIVKDKLQSKHCSKKTAEIIYHYLNK